MSTDWEAYYNHRQQRQGIKPAPQPAAKKAAPKVATTKCHDYKADFLRSEIASYEELAAAEKKAADEAAKYQREQSRALMNTALENIKKNGMSVTEFSPVEVAKFREKMKPVIAKHAATVGEATVNELMAELAKLRK
jgi:TRAP-type C4-dicarboxylate transport system substrate-binding protein